MQLADGPPRGGFVGKPRLTFQMAALIQGFPRDWKFSGRKTPAYRQVGNAFPPPVAQAVGHRVNVNGMRMYYEVSGAAAVTPVGIWRGTSVCLVHPSPCNDEVVVYRITKMKAADSVALDARKIVRGEEEEMGVLPCHVIPLNGQVTCTLPRGVWHFSVRRDSLVCELRLRDNTRYRDVRTMRAR